MTRRERLDLLKLESFRQRLAILLLGLLTAHAPSAAALDTFPNLRQTDKSMDCGPVAAANSLLWLANQGFTKLVDVPRTKDEGQNLVESLAKLMHTREMHGTFPNRMLIGTEKYLSQRGAKTKRFEYRGAGHHPARFGANGVAPEMGWLAAGVSSKSVAWLGVARTRLVPPDDYERVSAHWVSVIAVNRIKMTITVRDPAFDAPDGDEELQVDLVKSGRLLAYKGQPAVDLTGFPMVVGGMKKKRADYVLIVTSGIVLELE